MVTKAFDADLFSKYDQAAKDVFMQFLRAIGWNPRIPEDAYGVDIEVPAPDGKAFYFDVEVRPIWTDGGFPFETIHLPLRKEKFISEKTWFVSFRKDLKAFLLFQIKDKSRHKEVSNKYMATGEEFFDVPVAQTKFVDLNDWRYE